MFWLCWKRSIGFAESACSLSSSFSGDLFFEVSSAALQMDFYLLLLLGQVVGYLMLLRCLTSGILILRKSVPLTPLIPLTPLTPFPTLFLLLTAL